MDKQFILIEEEREEPSDADLKQILDADSSGWDAVYCESRDKMVSLVTDCPHCERALVCLR